MASLRTAQLTLISALISAPALAFVTGCSSASSTLGNTAATTSPSQRPSALSPSALSPSAESRAPGTSTPSSSSPAGGATGTAQPTGTPQPTGTAQPAGTGRVYFAESGNVTGTVVYKPACQSGCELSGDGTTSLWDMTWSTWTGTEAVGSGTEKLDDCNPNCAAGTLHSVPVKVTFTKPVKATCHGTARLYWTSVSFVWPDGLPTAFSGQNAPVNPFTYQGIGAAGDCGA
jgi:hypothetical protein